MIRADLLKNMVDSCGKVFARTDPPVIGFSAHDGHLEVFASGQTSSVRLRQGLEGPSSGRVFSCAVGQEELSKILGGCGSSIVELDSNGVSLVLSGIVNAKMPTQISNAEVKLELNDQFTVNSEWLKRCFQLTPKFCAKAKGRFSLHTAHFELSDGNAAFVATDGYKLVTSESQCKRWRGSDRKDITILKDHAGVIASIIPTLDNVDATIDVGPGGFKVSIGDVSFWCLMAEGGYPDWRSSMPSVEKTAPVDGKHLAKFSGIMEAVGVQKARFVCDGSTLKIYGKSQTVPEIDTRLDLHLDAGEVVLDPSLLAAASFEAGMVHFGFNANAAVLQSPPFTGLCMTISE